GERRRHPDVEHDEIGLRPSHRLEHAVGIGECRDDVVTAVAKQSGEALAQEGLVFGDQDAHGNSASSVVPVLLLWMRRVPPWAATRSERPVKPEPRSVVAPPTPSSATE